MDNVNGWTIHKVKGFDGFNYFIVKDGRTRGRAKKINGKWQALTKATEVDLFRGEDIKCVTNTLDELIVAVANADMNAKSASARRQASIRGQAIRDIK